MLKCNIVKAYFQLLKYAVIVIIDNYVLNESMYYYNIVMRKL